MNVNLRFSYTQVKTRDLLVKSRPILPITLRFRKNRQEANVFGLLDTGADVNVVPYEVGLALGLDWSLQRLAVRLGGNLAKYEARVVIIYGIVGDLAPVQLIFAWTQATQGPVILRQTNFFTRFNVHFYGAEDYFELERRDDDDPLITFME